MKSVPSSSTTSPKSGSVSSKSAKGTSQHAPPQQSQTSNLHVQSPLHHHPGQEDESHDNNINNIIHTLLHELKFEAMVGSANEPLPRLQNLQADYVNDSECDTSSDDNIGK